MRIKDFEENFTLWDELSDLGLHQTDAALNLCMVRLCTRVGAANAFWVGTVRMVKDDEEQADLLHGWRIRGLQYKDQPYLDPVRVRSDMQLTLPDQPGATNIALAAGAGKFRSYRLSADILVELASFRQTEHYDIYYTQPGVTDRLWVAFPVSADAESIFCFDRFNGQQEFTDADLESVAYALRGIKWFHRQLLLSHGLGICDEPLTMSERRVKHGLLSGATEKDIAQQLNLTQGTVHQYATRIYRKFGVKGRTEFMALWLSHAT